MVGPNFLHSQLRDQPQLRQNAIRPPAVRPFHKPNYHFARRPADDPDPYSADSRPITGSKKTPLRPEIKPLIPLTFRWKRLGW
jgi:hypothetical protein